MKMLKNVLMLISLIVYLSLMAVPIMAKQPSNEVSTDSAKIELLVEQNKLLKENNAQLLNVFMWSLGFVALFLVVYLGFNWFVAIRLHENDKEKVRMELEALLRELIKEETGVMSKSFLDRFANNEKWLDQWQAQTKSSFEKQLTDLQAKSANSIAALSGEFKESIRYVNNDIYELQFEMKELEANKWFSCEVYENAIMAFSDMLELATNKSYLEWRISNVLDSILKAVKKTDHMEADTSSRLETVLVKVPSKYRTIVTSIRSSVKH